VECPVCGLALARQPLPGPLLFQASALLRGAQPATQLQDEAPQAISTPALGRVPPLRLVPPEGEAVPLPFRPLESAPEPERSSPDASFWPLVRLEVCEAVLLLAINGLGAALVGWMVGAPLARAYAELWRFLVPFHAAVSWACLMVPLVLVGQSPFMAVLDLALDAPQPERRLSFSLFHLLSVALFPVSFLCMVLTPGHRTLAELLTGQEIVPDGRPRR